MDPHVVEVRHPAVVVHVPARSRAERLSLAEVSTPVAIAAIHPADLDRFDPGDLMDGTRRGPFSAWRGDRYARHDGGVWRGLQGRDRKGNLLPVGVSDLDGYLSRDPEAWLDLDDAFRGTPVAAWGLARTNDVLTASRPSKRGEAVDVDASRAIRRDDRARAGLSVARHLGRRLLLVGDEVYERIAPVLYLTDVGYSTHGQGGVLTARRLTPGRTLFASPLSREAAERHRRFGAPDMYAADVDGWMRLGIDAEIDALAPRAALDGLAGIVRMALDARLAAMSDGAEARDAVEGLRERVRSLELDALCGVAEGEDPLPGLRALADGLAAATDGKSFYYGDVNAAFTLPDLRAYHIPQAERTFASAMAEEDVEALARASRP